MQMEETLPPLRNFILPVCDFEYCRLLLIGVDPGVLPDESRSL